MKLIHAAQCAKRHGMAQVPIDTLRSIAPEGLSSGMANDFQRALLWHMEEHGTKIAELVEATGVSRDVINKLRGRGVASTAVENAVLIASFYGKSVNDFIACRPATAATRLRALFDLLPTEEQPRVEAQIRGLLDHLSRAEG